MPPEESISTHNARCISQKDKKTPTATVNDQRNTEAEHAWLATQRSHHEADVDVDAIPQACTASFLKCRPDVA